jgi:hypothetical protein
MLRVFQAGKDHRLHDAVDILLRELAENGSGGSGLTDQSFEVSDPFRTHAFDGERNLNSFLYYVSDNHRFLHCAGSSRKSTYGWTTIIRISV